jgi:hypothetical protein
MKKVPRQSAAFLFPGASGWRIRLPSGQTTSVQALGEAVASLPAGASVHLALPCNAALLERMVLPSVDRDELSGMVQLQLEKTLPYPVEEVSTDFDVIRQAENESTLISVAANHAQLDQLCEPLRSRAVVPEKVTLYAQHVAASCADEETVLCLWPEDGQVVVAVCERGKLGYAQTIPEGDPAAAASELPAVLLRAEMEGVPTEFDRVRIEQGCGGLRDLLAEITGKPVEIFSFDAPLPESDTNLVPSTWRDEKRKLESSGRLKARLQLAAMGFLLLVACAFIYLAWLKRQVQGLDGQIAQTRPAVEFQQEQQAKWQALAPAIDQNRYPVEVLNLLLGAIPSSEVKFTKFEFKPNDFKLDCVAPNADLWTKFTDKVRQDPVLSTYKLKMDPPKIEQSGVTFSISGTL